MVYYLKYYMVTIKGSDYTTWIFCSTKKIDAPILICLCSDVYNLIKGSFCHCAQEIKLETLKSIQIEFGFLGLRRIFGSYKDPLIAKNKIFGKFPTVSIRHFFIRTSESCEKLSQDLYYNMFDIENYIVN